MVSWLDQWAYRNRLSKLNATFKLTFALILLIWSLIGTNIVRLIIIVWLLVWLLGYARLPWRVCVRICTLMALVTLGSSAPLLFSFDGAVHFISESFLYVITICLRTFTSSVVLFFLAATTPFFRLVHALNKWRIPSVFIELLLLTYRFIFILEKVAKELFVTVQVKNGERNWRLASLAVAQLLRKALHDYEALMITQEARHVSFKIPACADEQLPKRYVIEAFIGVVVLLIVEGLYAKVS
ncbi:cobalt ABC transporter permease [Anoxybacillus flavithermus]|uniref:Cobalt ABC transporter permease n=1 Tax=Anoxybacillus flavithermus TaxID=33934 RepID=A0A2G5RT55_9BACL|nr:MULTISPECIES: CbiQ family ECF transporter T component [Anoxybacillus]KFZ43802.1 cobalt ABC transporter permease [Anoxybacillus sp. KU2-6(11)]PIC05893.1 cobalt ABC transporter permease [Anoxybacillus flavithermus]